MKRDVEKAIILGSAAFLLLFPREIKTEYKPRGGDEKKLTRFYLRTRLFGLDIDARKADKAVTLSLLPLSEFAEEKLRALSGKIEKGIADYSKKKKDRQERPIFGNALELVSKKNFVDIAYLARKLRVGQACAEAFLEIMEDMHVIVPSGDGKYRVVMPKNRITKLITQE